MMLSRETIARKLDAEGFERHAGLIRDGEAPNVVLALLETERVHDSEPFRPQWNEAIATLCEASNEVS